MSAPHESNGAPATTRPKWRDAVVGQLLVARIPLLVLGHLVVFALVYWLAFLLRFEFSIPNSEQYRFTYSLPILLVLKILIFYVIGHFHGWWRHVTFADLVALFKAATLSTFALIVIDHFTLPGQIPRSVTILDWGMTILAIGAIRSAVRAAREQSFWSKNGDETSRVLIIGAGYDSFRLADAIRSHPELNRQVIGLVSMNGEVKRRRFGSFQVVGKLKDIKKIAIKRNIQEILMQAGMISGPELRKLMDECSASGLHLKVIPDTIVRLDGNAKIPIRDIEINDLLRREPVVLEETSIAQLIAGKTVLVTGAGGSIGSELCRQIIQFHPHAMVLLGRGENRIYPIDLELRALRTDTVIHAKIGSVTDEPRMREIFSTFRPDIVFHAAAHKHVPLMEENVAEAIQNNVLGTKIVADLADEFDVERFVFISTDKAVQPSSVMGLTKQLGEQYVIALASESATRFIVTRFGNVLASNGSVVPLFKKQIQNGGPITVTDERMTRFFMTIPEASQLVLQAAAIGEDGQVIVLDMGEQIRVVDMARDLIRLAGLPEGSIEIQFTGLRPGEKLHEELFDAKETSVSMVHPKLHAAQCTPRTFADVSIQIKNLIELSTGSPENLRQLIHQFHSDCIPGPGLQTDLASHATPDKNSPPH